MVYCVAWGCTNNSEDRGNRPKFRGSWQKFPADIAVRRQWIARLSRAGYVWKPTHRLCSDHFQSSDFVLSREAAERLKFQVKRFELKPQAVPSCKLTAYVPPPEPRRSLAVAKRTNLQQAIPAAQATVLFTDRLPLSMATVEQQCTDVRHMQKVWKVVTDMSDEVLHSQRKLAEKLIADYKRQRHQVASDYDEVPACVQQETPPASRHHVECPTQTAKVHLITDYKKQRYQVTSDYDEVPTCFQQETPPATASRQHVECATQTAKVHTRPTETQCNLERPRATRKHQSSQTKSRLTCPTSERATQTGPVMVDQAVMCDLLTDPAPMDLPDPELEDGMDVDDEDVDETYEPSWSSESSDEELEDSSDDESHVKDENLPLRDSETFLVFGSCLRLLLAMCLFCGTEACNVIIKRRLGTAAVFQRICPNRNCRRTSEWTSQPLLSSMAEGNLRLAAGIFFSGCSPVKALNCLRSINLSSIKMRTYQLIQRCYLVPAVSRVWQRHRTALVTTARQAGGVLRLAGDGRCDSPGHNAKYGTYTIMDTTSKKIIDQKIVQCNQVSSSNAMEKEGLRRCMDQLREDDLHAEHLVTDRHPSVKKYMREQHPETRHYFDIWHIAKGLKQKVLAKAKTKDYRGLALWAQGIVNHLYWIAMSSHGDAELVQAKYVAIINHVCDIHEGHGEKFPHCEHGPFEGDEERVWMKIGSRMHKALIAILTPRFLLKDIGQMSPHAQTSSLESFHKLVCFFAPKSTHYFYNQMEARSYLAALHFNENAGRDQRGLEEGAPQWAASYPKHRDGDGVVKKVRVPCTYGYVAELMTEALYLRQEYNSYRKADVLVKAQPVPITHSMELVEKSELMERYSSRFGTE